MKASSFDATGRMARIKDYWEESALKYGASHQASWEDENVMRMEQEVVSSFIEPGSLVLDAGCANGFTTFQILKKKPTAVRAYDYSANMLSGALKEQATMDPEGVISFAQANILEIPEKDDTFDVAYTIRVIINLPEWDLQARAIKEVHRVLKPGSLYILSEAFAGSNTRLNALRKLGGLPPLEPPSYNLYLDEEVLEPFLKEHFQIVEVKKFSSLYYVASRFLRELAMNEGEAQSYDHPINEFFKLWPSTAQSGDFGLQKAYVLKKP